MHNASLTAVAHSATGEEDSNLTGSDSNVLVLEVQQHRVHPLPRRLDGELAGEPVGAQVHAVQYVRRPVPCDG